MAHGNAVAAKKEDFLESLFHLRENKTTVRTEVIAGLTTFMTMAYIIIVNPNILSKAGMDIGAVTVATCLGAALGTFVMALYANYPFAMAPGMGLNAFFAFTVCLGMGISWQVALGIAFIDGVICLLLTLTRARQAIINSVPMTLKLATGVGIGLFIAFIGLQEAGIVVKNDATLVSLGKISSPNVLLALFGLAVIGLLLSRKVKGALLLGIMITSVVAMIVGLTPFPRSIKDIIGAPPSLAPTFLKMDVLGALNIGLIAIIFTFTFVDLFDTVGTLIGVSTKAGFLDKDGQLPRSGQALISDSIGSVGGALFGTSTVTTYIESAAGVAEGGRTGLTAAVVAVLFLLSLFFAPLVKLIPSAATAPALIIVGLFMMEPVLKLNLSDYTEAIPAFLTIIMMPLAYSIAEGLVFGVLSYVIIKTLAGKMKDVSLTMWILAILFVIRFIIMR
ncbi:MAG TPA: NCS2 family permease [Firmicutes bacterium]|nr:NCS2 family permease [Bacillota bacterium]HHY98671.1 NCS2 family permease [Bacillota bacterium]